MALKYFSQNWIVRLLGHRTLAPSMVSTHIPAADLDDSVAWIIQIRYSIG